MITKKNIQDYTFSIKNISNTHKLKITKLLDENGMSHAWEKPNRARPSAVQWNNPYLRYSKIQREWIRTNNNIDNAIIVDIEEFFKVLEPNYRKWEL